MNRGDVQVATTTLSSGVTATGAQGWVRRNGNGMSTFQAVVTGTGAVTATVLLEVSNDGTNAISPGMGTIGLSGTTTASDGFAVLAPWAFVRANVTAISGTGAAVTVTEGY